MNALTPTPNSLPAKPTSPAATPQLIEWLRRTEEPEQMALSLIRSGKVSTLKAAVPELREALADEAGAEGVKAVLKAYFGVFPQPERDAEEWASFWAGYTLACGHLSHAALRAGMQAWVQKPDSQFLPKPGELRALAGATPTDAHQIYAKARAVLDACEREAERQRIAADMAARGTTKEAQARQVREMLAEYVQESARRRNAEAAMGIPHANRAQVPEGPLNSVQIDILKKCGKL